MIQQGINQFLGLLAANARTKEMVADKAAATQRTNEMHSAKLAQIQAETKGSQQLTESTLKTQKLQQKQLRMVNKTLKDNPELVKEIAMQSMTSKGIFTHEQKKAFKESAGGDE